MGLFSIKPARTQAEQTDVKIVADLDKLIAEPVGFKLNGKIHVIKPITTRQFLKVCDKLGKLDLLQKKLQATGRIDEEDLVDRYHDIFKACSDTMTKDDLMGMTHSQRAALLNIILECVGGKAQVAKEAEEKKTLASTS